MALLKAKTKKNERVEKMKESVGNQLGMKPLNLSIDGDLLRNFKIATIRTGTTMTEVLTRAMKDYLKSAGK